MSMLTRFRILSGSGVPWRARRGGTGTTTVSVRRLHLMSALDGISRFPRPWQEFIEPVDGMTVHHALKNVGDIGVGLDVVELGGLDQRADDGPAVPATVAAGEQMVLAPESDGTDRAFDRIGVEFDAPVMQEPGQGLPTGERIADRLGERAASGDLRELGLQPGAQFGHERAGVLPTRGKPIGRRLPADLRLDGIEFADPAQRIGGNRRSGGLRNVIELAPGVRPARGENDIAFARQLLEAGIATDVLHVGEVLKMCHRALGSAGWSLSSAMARFCSSLKKRRTGCGTGSGSSFVGAVNGLSVSILLALVPAAGRAEG